MKNIITNLDVFINEELKKSTYLSAANKLSEIGHLKRSTKLKKYAKDFEDDKDFKDFYYNFTFDKYHTKLQISYHNNDMDIVLYISDEYDKIEVNDFDIYDRINANKIYKLFKEYIEFLINRYKTYAVRKSIEKQNNEIKIELLETLNKKLSPNYFYKSILDKYIGKKLFVTRENHTGSISVDCGIFTNENIGGYGIGIKGDIFNENDFKNAISKKGDVLKRRLFTLDELNELFDYLKIDKTLDIYGKEETLDIYEKEEMLKNLIKYERESYSSDDPDLEREKYVYVELDELFD